MEKSENDFTENLGQSQQFRFEILNAEQKKSVYLSIEQAMDLVGDKNLYQYQLALLMICQYTLVSFVFMSPTFFLSDPRFICPGSLEELTENNGGCGQGCQLIEERCSTMTKQFGLFCGSQQNIRGSTISLMYVGVVIGNLLFGWLGDKYGRRKVILLGWFLGTFGVLMIGLSESYGMLLFSLIFTGITLWPPLNMAIIMVNEQSGTQFRQYASLCIMLSFGLGESILALVVYFMKTWQATVLIFMFAPCLLLNLQYFIIQDSPKFWINKSQSLTIHYLNNIAKINKKQYLDPIKTFIKLEGESVDYRIQKENQNYQRPYSFLDLFTYKSLRLITLGSSVLTFTLQIIYFGCQFALSSIGLNVYINTVVAGMSQVIVLIPSMWVIPKIKRKTWLFIFHLISIVLSFSYLIVDNMIFQTINAGIIKATNRIALSIFTIYVIEVYPTTVRSLGNGFNFSIAQIGSTVAPLLIQLGLEIHMNALFLVACISSIGLLTYPLIKETFQKPLYDEILEIREINIQIQQIYNNSQQPENNQRNKDLNELISNSQIQEKNNSQNKIQTEVQ